MFISLASCLSALPAAAPEQTPRLRPSVGGLVVKATTLRTGGRTRRFQVDGGSSEAAEGGRRGGSSRLVSIWRPLWRSVLLIHHFIEQTSALWFGPSGPVRPTQLHCCLDAGHTGRRLEDHVLPPPPAIIYAPF